ncbi:hypothetical protein BS78_01G359300 [Paspalum vaginatum]|nr:hypothetical protein BS78_01G359300 [Paspalum vaginatum]
MAPKSLVLGALLIVAAAAASTARGAALGTSTNTSALISGVVPCAVGNSINLATVPIFPNASLQLVRAGKVVTSATADGNGVFVINLVGIARPMVSDLVTNGCKVVVLTPLGACDKSLAGAVGTLSAPLKLLGLDTGSGSGDIGGLVGGIVGIVIGLVNGILGGLINLGTQAFSFV